MKSRSDPYLKKLYRRYNKLYFSNALPRDLVIRWMDTTAQRVRECDSKNVVGCADAQSILIDRRYHKMRWWNQLKFTLMHEMVHVKLAHRRVQPHGRAFQMEMLKLGAIGAFKSLW